jgi:hypothetical protein
MEQKLKRTMLKIEEIEIEQKRKINLQNNRKYKKIVSSIKNIGLIEPLSIYQQKNRFILLDGYLRLLAAKEIDMYEVPCFIYKNRDSYTFNAMRNELSPLQESKMIKKAVSQGVDENDLAIVLNVSLKRIRQTQKLVDSLIPEAKELLDGNYIFRSTAEQLGRVNHKGQRRILKKMDEAQNYNTSYAKVLVMKTPKEMIRSGISIRNDNPDHSKKRLYTQIEKGNQEIEFYAQRYKENMKELMKHVVFFRTILEREATSEYLSLNYPQMVKDVKKILNRSEIEVLS